MNPFDLLKSLNIDDIKKQAQNMQTKLDSIVETGESGGGFVKVTLNGNFKILNIEYEENEWIKEDLKTFKDLILSAHNAASDKIKESIKKQLSSNFIPGII